MAYANTRLIRALRVTADRLREGAAYQWGLEYLADRRVLGRMGPRTHLHRNHREDVVAYLDAWAELLAEELAARETSAGAAASQPVVQPSASPRAGFFGEGAEPKRRCTGRTASFGDNALVEKAKRGGVMGCTTGC